MQNNLQAHIKLFENIEAENLSGMLSCLGAKTKRYHKGDILFFSEDRVDNIGIILEGAVIITKDDYSGNRSIVDRFEQYEIFAEAFVCAGISKSPVTVMAVEESEIMWIQFRRIITNCATTCDFHTKLIENMIKLLAIKNINLTRKMEIMSKRNLREKLLAYFYLQAERAKSLDFSIPLTRAELADYLYVNRSALSRELSNLSKEGIIKFRKNQFSIIK